MFAQKQEKPGEGPPDLSPFMSEAVFEHPMAAFVRVQADGFQDVVGE